MGRRVIRGLKMRVGWECSISRRRARMYSGGIHVGGVRGESHSITSGGTAGVAAPRVRAAKSSNLERKVVSTLDGPIWSKRSIALTCPGQITFPVYTEQGKMGPGLG